MIHRITLSTLALLAALATSVDVNAAIDPRVPMGDRSPPSDNITLTFSAPVQADRTTIKLSGPRGPVPIGDLRSGGDPAEVIVPVSTDLPSGLYVIRFDAYSTSGEAMSGTSSVIVPPREFLPSTGYGLSTDAFRRP
jgi:methionine-rich copper-binding protein CopC